VASNTLRGVDWAPAELLTASLPEAVQKLKEVGRGAIYVHGSLNLAQQLLRHGLVDRVRLLSYPVALGDGKRLFADKLSLELISARPFSNGVVALEYAP